MKKQIICAAILTLSCFLAGCSKPSETGTVHSPPEIAETIIDSQSDMPTLHTITAEDDYFATYLVNYYLLDSEKVTNGVICYADGVEAAEIAVLVFGSEADARAAESTLLDYLNARAGSFEGYAPQQAALVKDGAAVVYGNCAALLICPDMVGAKAAFLSCFGEDTELPSSAAYASAPTAAEETAEPALSADSAQSSAVPPGENPEVLTTPEDQIVPEAAPASAVPALDQTVPSLDPVPTPEPTATQEMPSPVIDEAYSAASVLRAWQTGDDSALSDINRAILDAARAVIIREISDGMTDYEKELAIHDYITGWSGFSMSAFSHAPGSDGGTDADTPYGVLVNRSGNCWGYSSTFQLFMDMLGIECVTVRGTPNSGGVEHAWNMVRLDGEWYCVDTAWDDPIGGRPGHSYFNLTSEQFRQTGIHHWDETTVPEATGTTYRYGAN